MKKILALILSLAMIISIPVAMTSRASSVERVYLSLCVAAAMLKK